MSIWCSIGLGEAPIMGLDYDDDAAHYRGEGEPTIDVGVATTAWHSLLRLSINGPEFNPDADVLLPVDQARRLADHLTEAIEIVERNEQRRAERHGQATTPHA